MSGSENRQKVEREISSNISLIINNLCNTFKILMFIYKEGKRKTEEHEGELFTSSYSPDFHSVLVVGAQSCLSNNKIIELGIIKGQVWMMPIYCKFEAFQLTFISLCQ